MTVSQAGPTPGTTDPVTVRLNGEQVRADVTRGQLLLDFLRSERRLTGPKRSCDVQMCGACTVLVDGLPVSSCCYLAVEADGRSVDTVEGLASPDHPGHGLYQLIEDAFTAHAAAQCGFCTPGFVTTLYFLISRGEVTAQSSDEQLEALLRGNLCRCTGYDAIVEATRTVLDTYRAR